MALFYKQFLRSRTVFWLVFSIFCIVGGLSAQNAHAADDIFTVERVKVDVTAKDALQARDQAFEKAQIEAFKILAARVLSESEAENMKMPVTMVISNMIQDYEVTKEKLSTVRYIGTYTFRFKDRDVKRYFTGHGSAYTDVSSSPVLALPFWQSHAGALLWSPYNVWLTAWNRAKNLTGLVPVTVPLGDLADVRDVSDGEALHYERRKLRNMLRRYNASEAVILIAEPDQELAQIQSDNDTASGRLYIQIYRTDRSEPELVQRIQIAPRGAETRGAFLDRAVKEVHKTLQKDWKQKTIVAPTNTANRLSVRVHIQNLQQWAEMQQALKVVNGIERIELQSLSPKFARVDLIYQGSMDRLNLALKQANMTLESPAIPQGRKELSRYSINNFLAGGYNNQADITYDLYLDKYRPIRTQSPQAGTSPTQKSPYEYHFKPQPKNSHRAGYPSRNIPPTRSKDGTFQADF